MRIVHVSDCYAPRTGGIESQVRDLARAQAAAGHDVRVLTATRGAAGHGGVEDDDGVAVHRMGTDLPFDLPVNPAAGGRMADLMRAVAADVVHVHAGVVSPVAFDGARAALRTGSPLAITWHCMLDGVVPALRVGVRRTAWRSAPAALSAVSGAAADRVRAVFDREVAVVPNGVDLDDWRPSGPDQRAPGPLRTVATMRLAPRKRVVPLVRLVGDAAAQLEPGAISLDLIGDGPLAGAVDRRIARFDLVDVVRRRGRLPREELPGVYGTMDVFLAPADLEAFGIAALEARAAGLVVVGRRGTGLTEYLTDGHDALLVDDDAAMGRALMRLAREPELLGRLRAAARAERPRHSWQLTLDAAAREYERARDLRSRAAQAVD